MILKEVLLETKDNNLFPQPMLIFDRFLESSSYINDECLLSGRIIEIGAYQGGTTCRLAYMAKKYNLKPIVSIDIWEDNGTSQAKLENMSDDIFKRFLNNINNNELSKYVEYYKEDSKIVGKRWNEKVGLIIFDGSHYYEDVKQDMLIWKDFIINKGVVIIDDFGSWDNTPGPEGAAKEVFLSDPEYKVIYSNNTFLVLEKN